MRKKILFIIPEYSHGGTNKSLENLLTFMDKSKYDISIFCLYEDGPDYYKKLFAPYILKKSHLYYWLHDNAFTRKIMGLYNKFTKKNNFEFLYKREAKLIQKKYTFDVVIAYQEGASTVFVTYFDTKRKIAWYHRPYVDFNNIEYYTKLYSTFDAIPCVSNVFVKMFQDALPLVKDKVCCIYNTLNNDFIRQSANKEEKDEDFKTDSFTMVSVGRFVPQKQFELIPSIVDKINEFGNTRPFKWYIIASGDKCREKTLNEISKYGLENQVIILGAKSNPYFYMAKSDLVVCTSDSESFSYVIAEGKIVHTPVVSNDFPVAYEVLDKNCGWITSVEEMPSQLYRLINDINGEYSKIKKCIENYEYDNNAIMDKIYQIIDK
jgi:glycosyltransferase involved in cell wall biosynthesis